MDSPRSWRLASLIASAGVVAAVAGDMFRDTLERLASLALMDEYSYMIPLSLVLAALVYITLSESIIGPRPTVGRIIGIALYSSVSATLYILASVDPEYSLQYRSAAFALLLAAIILSVTHPTRKHHLIVLASLALIIPPPISWLSEVARRLAPVIAKIASTITGAEYVSANGRVLLIVDSPNGQVSLEIARACTGIVSSSSILALAPLIAYYAGASRVSKPRKVLAALASITIALALSFAGNLARIILMVRAAQAEGLEAALRIFHSTPAPLYAALAVIAAFLVLRKLAGRVDLTPAGAPNINIPRAIIGLLAVSLVLTAYNAVIQSSNAVTQEVSLTPPTLSGIIGDPASALVEATGARLLNAVDRQDLRWLLGSSKVVLFRLEYEGVPLTGYVEVADSQARFHAWHLCLEAQGYTVKEIWSIGNDDLRLYQVRYTSGARDRLILYTIIPVEADAGGSRVTVYLRVSVALLASQTREYEAALDFLSQAYYNLAARQVGGEGSQAGVLDKLVLIDYGLVLAGLGYAGLNLAVIAYNRGRGKRPVWPRVPR